MIHVRRYISNYFDSNCYVIYNDDVAIIIDPSVPYDVIRKDIKKDIKAILITHGHFDHFYHLNSYIDNIKDVKIYLHKDAIEKLENANLNYSDQIMAPLEIICDDKFIKVKEGDVISIVDGFNINVLETPGHSNCSVTFIINDLMFTGDFLFKHSIGRTDLYSASSIMMKKSLERMKDFHDLSYNDFYLYPGHDDFSTLNDEKKNNFYMR